MSKDIPAQNRLIKLGRGEWVGASKLAADFGLGDPQVGARMGVTVAISLNNARRLGFSLQLTGGDGRKYAYDLCTPKVAYELDKQGGRSGKSINLIEIEPKRPPTKTNPKLKVVK